MIIPGPTETLQILDGSATLPTMRFLSNSQERIAFAAPAMAYAADAIAGVTGPERQRLENTLCDLLDHCREPLALGLAVGPPQYTLMPFGRDEVRAFPRIREALHTSAGALEMQTLAISHLADVPLLLIKTAANMRTIATLSAAGIRLRITWIE